MGKKWNRYSLFLGGKKKTSSTLFRLSPVIPYNLLNLAAAATSVGLLPFALASAVGIVPECALLVYAGEFFSSSFLRFFFFFSSRFFLFFLRSSFSAGGGSSRSKELTFFFFLLRNASTVTITRLPRRVHHRRRLWDGHEETQEDHVDLGGTNDRCRGRSGRRCDTARAEGR